MFNQRRRYIDMMHRSGDQVGKCSKAGGSNGVLWALLDDRGNHKGQSNRKRQRKWMEGTETVKEMFWRQKRRKEMRNP